MLKGYSTASARQYVQPPELQRKREREKGRKEERKEGRREGRRKGVYK
jgi:hypothetical protein